LSAKTIAEYVLKHHAKGISPTVRHALRVAYGAMPGAHPIDHAVATLFRYGREVENIDLMVQLVALMDAANRQVPLCFPDEDKPDFIVTPQGEMIWEAPKPPPKPPETLQDPAESPDP
jgi:hypothetical protein